MIRKRFGELREGDNRRLVVTAVELVEQRVAVGAGIEKSRERILVPDKGLLLRLEDHIGQLDRLVCVDPFVGRPEQLQLRENTDACELDWRRYVGYGMQGISAFSASDRIT